MVHQLTAARMLWVGALVDYFKELNYPAQTERFKRSYTNTLLNCLKVDKDWLIEIANDRVNKELPRDELHDTHHAKH